MSFFSGRAVLQQCHLDKNDIESYRAVFFVEYCHILGYDKRKGSEGDMMDFAQEEKILKKLFNVDMYKDIKDNDINVNEIMEQMEDIIEAGQALEVGFDNILNK